MLHHTLGCFFTGGHPGQSSKSETAILVCFRPGPWKAFFSFHPSPAWHLRVFHHTMGCLTGYVSYIRMYVCVCIYIYMYICVYTCIYVCKCMCMYIYIYIYVCVCVLIYLSIYRSIDRSICMYLCTYSPYTQ